MPTAQWIPSHAHLGDHPKLKRAARLAGVGLPQMIGHLHLLWWWTLKFAPDGDVTDFEVADLADGAGWDGDASVLFTALLECGPGQSAGFVEFVGERTVLHDWDEYGGSYTRRVESARKAAETRWAKHREEAPAVRSHEVPDAVGNAEERRGEEKTGEDKEDMDEPRRKRRSRMSEDWVPDPVKLVRLQQQFPDLSLGEETAKFRDYWISKGEIRADWDASLRSWMRNAERYRQERMGVPAGGWR
jgi:hypothetical protein